MEDRNVTAGLSDIDEDSLSRSRIVTETDTNFFVEAGAGSGKTTMLVSRMVAMIEQGKPIDKICAITFTKAAAGEFYDRFQKELIRRSSPDYVWEDRGFAGQLPAPTEETRERCREALEDIDLCFMGTIDSFCNMILSEHPYDAHIPSDASIMTDEEVRTLMREEYVHICEGKYGEELKKKATVFRSVQEKDVDAFTDGMSFLMDNRNVHFNYRDPGTADIDKDFAKDRKRIIHVLSGLSEHPELRSDGSKGSREAWDKLPDMLKQIKRKWSTNFSRVLYALGELKELRTVTDPEDSGIRTDGLFTPHVGRGSWYDFTIGEEGGVLEGLSSLQYNASMSFLTDCVEIAAKVRRDKGRMTFFDYLYYLKNMLRDDASHEGKLIQYIYNRHRFFLIDEFQDTNPMQAEIFFYLTAESPRAEWYECIPRQGSLFIVGDPKQSIYRFRGADVTSFLRVKKLFTGRAGAVLSLYRNFRSAKVLCEYYNRVFAEILKEETGTQSSFTAIPLPPENKDKEFAGRFSYKAYVGKEGVKTYPDLTDEKQISRVILSLVNNDAYKIRTEGDKGPRRIRYSDFMIITAAKTNQPAIMAQLKEKGIPVKVEGSVPFDTTEALKEIEKVYAAVADPGERLLFHSALTGALIGQRTDDILHYKMAGGHETLNGAAAVVGNTDGAVRKVADAVMNVRLLYEKAQKLSPAALYSEILEQYRVFEKLEAENLEVIYYVLELMRNGEEAGKIITHRDGADYLRSLIARGAGEERCLSLRQDTDRVHLSNLHKVKGLEAPVVILAYGADKPQGQSVRIEHLDSGTEGYIFSLSPETKDADGSFKAASAYFKTEEFSDKKEEEKAAGKDENDRLVYVAATRAKNALIICNSFSVRTSGKGTTESRYTKWKDLLEPGTPDLFSSVPSKETEDKEPSGQEAASGLYEEAARGCALNDRSGEGPTYEEKTPSRLKLRTKIVKTDDRKADPDSAAALQADDSSLRAEENVENAGEVLNTKHSAELSIVHRYPDLLGTMTHRIMEILVLTRNKVSTEQMVQKILCEYETPEIRPLEDAFKKALETVAETIRNGGYDQVNGSEKDILSILMEADEVYPEVPFCCKDRENTAVIWNGIMDVIYHKDGAWHIVDYKTNVDGEGLDEKYAGQLDAYRKALKEITGIEADARIYHIDI